VGPEGVHALALRTRIGDRSQLVCAEPYSGTRATANPSNAVPDQHKPNAVRLLDIFADYRLLTWAAIENPANSRSWSRGANDSPKQVPEQAYFRRKAHSEQIQTVTDTEPCGPFRQPANGAEAIKTDT